MARVGIENIKFMYVGFFYEFWISKGEISVVMSCETWEVFQLISDEKEND